jgi:CRISPR/Cas system CMR subunit Cmr4 (Cas7 group RAMP superfamily)
MNDWTDSRRITQRVVVTGHLRLLTPAHLGNGDRGEQVDMPLLRDPQDDSALLTGTSITGAIRSYLQAYQYGHFVPEDKQKRESTVALLFGGVKGDEEGEQSSLIVDDARADLIAPEIRDGVKINPQRRVAEAGGKYDVELLPTETIFPLRFELLLPDDEVKAQRLQIALVCALQGFEAGEILIGARKSRGFGRCKVEGWRLTTYNLRNLNSLVAWLTADLSSVQPVDGELRPIADLLRGQGSPGKDQRHEFRIEATFALDSPLLIRSDEPLTEGDNQPDFAHLRDSMGRPIVPGTSLAGALRARAMRILNTVRSQHPELTIRMLDCLFGRDMHARRGDPTMSRMVVQESLINQGRTLVQNRVAIDRFTGGAFETALFGEAPYVGGTVTLTMTIREPKHDADKGLSLLLLKDLWTGDLPLGGTSSIGRGRLRGLHATIYERTPEQETTWDLVNHNGKLTIPDDARQKLEAYVSALMTVEEQVYA